jgi:hypothetical protein
VPRAGELVLQPPHLEAVFGAAAAWGCADIGFGLRDLDGVAALVRGVALVFVTSLLLYPSPWAKTNGVASMVTKIRQSSRDICLSTRNSSLSFASNSRHSITDSLNVYPCLYGF